MRADDYYDFDNSWLRIEFVCGFIGDDEGDIEDEIEGRTEDEEITEFWGGGDWEREDELKEEIYDEDLLIYDWITVYKDGEIEYYGDWDLQF